MNIFGSIFSDGLSQIVSAPFSPSIMEKCELRVRWLVLFLSCVLMIGNYYCFDNPAALKSQLQQHFNNIPKDRYEFLFVRSDLYVIPAFSSITLEKNTNSTICYE